MKKVFLVVLLIVIFAVYIAWYIATPKKVIQCSSMPDDGRCFEYNCTGIAGAGFGSPASFLGKCTFIGESVAQ